VIYKSREWGGPGPLGFGAPEKDEFKWTEIVFVSIRDIFPTLYSSTQQTKNTYYEHHRYFSLSFMSINYMVAESPYCGFLQIFTLILRLPK
jgi:hypothetical protein